MTGIDRVDAAFGGLLGQPRRLQRRVVRPCLHQPGLGLRRLRRLQRNLVAQRLHRQRRAGELHQRAARVEQREFGIDDRLLGEGIEGLRFLDADARAQSGLQALVGLVDELRVGGALGAVGVERVGGGEQRIDRIGVVAEWPLFQGGLVRAQSREAGARLRGAQAQREASLRALERDTLAAFRGVTAGIRIIRAARSAVDANRIALDASRNGVEAGTRTEFDLLNAQNNYYRALRAAYQSRYDYLRNTLRLKAQAGRLSETDLAAIDALLVSGRSIDLPAEMQP